ncbi:MAG TPA: PGDYG domain-containing protein [Steroidobacteraceae bacterium]|nr:PGDYG domain-containing protein [Steroidobacteraceae bacterium]
MLDLGCPDLAHDPAAVRVYKDEVVHVEFAASAGALKSAVGMNHYAAGDALLTGSTGDRWCVSRDRFDAKYRPCAGTAAGAAGRYRNLPVVILAKQIHEPFRVSRTAGGDVLTGEAGDWAVEYAPGDCGLVARARFEAVYRIAATGRGGAG